jgi:energy-coupling factor transporter ATP-binding protein EcfA2
MLVHVLRRAFAFVKTRYEARLDYKRFKDALILGSIVVLITAAVNPMVGGGFSGLLLLYYYYRIHREYFSEKKSYYENILLPLMVADHYVRIGYEIPEDNELLEDHIKIAAMPKDQAVKELAKREKQARKKPWTLVGISKNVMTRHFWLIGATGAGKTSLLMTLFKAVMKVGAGLIFVDGKSDAKMFRKLYSLAKEIGREFSVYVINLLKPEETKFDTNTFQPLATLSPSAQVEFLASIASTGASGDMAYWEGRGKSLLAPVIFTLALRKKYWYEGYSYQNVNTALSAMEFSLYAVILGVLAKALNDKIGKDPRMTKFLRDARKYATPRSSVENLEVLTAYLIQYPHKAEEIERLGYRRSFIEDTYMAYRTAIETYLGTLSTVWTQNVKKAIEGMYSMMKQRGKNPLGLSFVELREEYERFLKTDPNVGKALTDIPEKDAVQHNYAQQQWTLLFTAFDKFSHVFGATDPDVDMLDILRNNKVLYVLLPVLEQDKKSAEILGKTVVMAIKSAASTALGGKIEGLTNTQLNIVESRITPIPLGLVVLDEYGAYPVPDIDTLAAQVRSINMSFWLSTQDYTSARVGGTDENSVKRVWANTSKVVLKLEDPETRDNLERLIKEKYVATVSGATQLDSSTETPEATVSVQKEKWIDLEKTSRFDKGMSLWIVNGKPAYVQCFWADQPEIDRLLLNRYEPVYPVTVR